MKVIVTYKRISCWCPVLGINKINPFLVNLFVFWKKERQVFLTSCITTSEICNNTFINHVDIICKMIRHGIGDLDVLCL